MKHLKPLLSILFIMCAAGVNSKKQKNRDIMLYSIENPSKLRIEIPDGDNHPFPDEDFERESLERANEYRARHGVRPLELLPDLCVDSLKYAKYLADHHSMQNRPYYKYGEIIFSGTRGVRTPSTLCVDSAYKQIKVYNFDNPKPELKVGHFTQLIWKNSKRFGIGYAISKNGTIYVVMNFHPPGNYDWLLKSEVPKLVDSEFENEVLNLHNRYRYLHGAKPLNHSRNLCYEAQEYADHLARLDKIVTRPNSKFGENIFAGYPKLKRFAKVAVQSCYKEVKKYDFKKPGYSNETGHFTQVVWKATKELGMGYAYSKSGKVYVVFVYDPPGNVDSQEEFKKNVRDFVNFPLENSIVDKHNVYRKRHRAPPLKVNRDLSDEAQEYLNKITARGQFIPQRNPKHNQNLCQLDKYYVKAGYDCVTAWYNERVHYDFNLHEYQPKAAHFSQVIWKNSTEVGIATSNATNGKFNIIVNYNPNGNVVGHFSKNIQKAKS